jgi:hypothetical protein
VPEVGICGFPEKGMINVKELFYLVNFHSLIDFRSLFLHTLVRFDPQGMNHNFNALIIFPLRKVLDYLKELHQVFSFASLDVKPQQPT